MFWLAATGLLVIAIAVVAVALLRKPVQRVQRSREATVAALYRDRLAELEQELVSGQLAAVDRAAVEEELSLSLLDDYAEEGALPSTPVQATGSAAPDAGASTPAASRGTRTLVIVAALCLAIGSFGLYALIGDPAAEELRGAERLLQLDPEQQRDALLEWQSRLESRVARRSNDVKSWYLLGHAHLKLADYQSAAEAFARASAAHGDDTSIDVYWLQARYLAAGGVIDAGTRAIAERLLAADPNHLLVLEMYAIDAFRNSEFRQAVSYLDRALSRALDPAQRASLQAGLVEARAQLGVLLPSVDVAVSVQGGVPRGATLFVIARPVGGGMPFAVVRRPAADFPLSIRLDDAVSMNPAQALSAAAEVEIAVRLSLSGTPLAQPGDWEWQSAPIALQGLDAPVQLEAVLAPPA